MSTKKINLLSILSCMFLILGTFCFAEDEISQDETFKSEITQAETSQQKISEEIPQEENNPSEKNKWQPKIDVDFKIYTPTLLGFVAGNNAFFGLRENSSEVDSCTNFMFEGRAGFIPFSKVSYSFSFGTSGYIENNKNPDDNLMSMNLSLGGGLYFHLFDDMPTFSLNGLCLYLYPVYQIPVYTKGYEPYLKWKMAVDLGYNFTLLDGISVYPFYRNIIGWNADDFRWGFDLGIAVGFYFRDGIATKAVQSEKKYFIRI